MFVMGFSRWQLFKTLAAIVGIVGIVSLTLIHFIPAPPSKVVMATAFKGASFDYYGRQYQEIFARYNVDLELRETAGAVEKVKLLQDPKSGVQIGFVTGGVSDAKHAPDVLSLGTVYNQPFWIFYSSNEQLDRLSQLKGKRIAVGPVGSATRYTAEQILGRGGINSENATLLPFAGSDADKALNDGKVDVVWIIGVAEATAVQSFLRNPNVRLMSFANAEAFTRIFPDLNRLVLPQGVVDIDQNIPPADVQLIRTRLDKLNGVLPVAPVLDVAQALDNPFLADTQMIRNVPHPAKPGLRALANPIKINGKRLEQSVCSPLGADNAAFTGQPSRRGRGTAAKSTSARER
jgi:NMT1-like family